MSAKQITFGEFAKRARKQRGLGLREAARTLGFSASYLCRVETNTDAPSPNMLAAMSRKYNVAVVRLVDYWPHKRAEIYGHCLVNLDKHEVDAFVRQFCKTITENHNHD